MKWQIDRNMRSLTDNNIIKIFEKILNMNYVSIMIV